MPIDRRTLLTGALANASGIAVSRPPMASVLGAHMPARAQQTAADGPPFLVCTRRSTAATTRCPRQRTALIADNQSAKPSCHV